MLHRCDCKHEWQDKKYGQEVRVFNPRPDRKARCTVCAKEINFEDKKKK